MTFGPDGALFKIRVCPGQVTSAEGMRKLGTLPSQTDVKVRAGPQFASVPCVVSADKQAACI